MTFDTLWNFAVANLNYILITAGLILAYLAGTTKSISGAISSAWAVVLQVVAFFAEAVKEQDGNGGKTSFSRILGVYVTYQIVKMAWVILFDATATIPGELMTLFWVTIGYAMLSKLFTTASPLLQQLVAGYLTKVQKLTPTVPAPPPPAQGA
jgi:hypothetical protein